jgi:hypothetical protein
MQQFGSAAEIAVNLSGRRYVDAEFMYKARPADGRERIVFDYSLNSRLAQLASQDAVLFICDSQQTIDSLKIFESQHPYLHMVAVITNPSLWKGATNETPKFLNWENPVLWRRYAMTDRWSRIDFALQLGSLMKSPGYVIMPAHDAVWGQGLLARLTYLSELYWRQGLPAAVSPYTYFQHSPVPGAHIPQDIIDIMNTAFGRDTLLAWKIRLDRVQAFWGKMGMMPFSICGPVRDQVEKTVWEDDLEIDSAIRQLGHGVHCWWASDPTIYRQAPPVFDRDGLRKVIERTLHYSLNIPGNVVGASTLNFPLDVVGQIKRRINPRFARNNAEAEALIAECNQEIQARLQQYGASWVDWGLYRYVMRVGDPAVEVWKRESILV